ncbi:MAG: NifU family protein [Cytophagaceae bacterium]
METTKAPVEIYLEATPNPNTLKFVTDKNLVPEGSVDFASPSSAESCPMVLDLFRFDFVRRVFMAANFVTVTKADGIDWIEVQNMIRSVIKGYLEEGKPLFKSMPQQVSNVAPVEGEPEVVSKIKVVLDEYIRPAVEQDGGAITFHSFNEGVVKVQLQGSCSGCPSSTVTLKSGIENLLKRMIPEVTEVVAENM